MISYHLSPSENTRLSLLEAKNGICRVATSPLGKNWPGVGRIYLQLKDGRWLTLEAGQEDLESRFEVFPIEASIVESKPETKLEREYFLDAPVSIVELETEDWLDHTVPCKGALGSTPIMQ